MIFFEYEQVVKIHRSLIEKTGGMDGIRDAQLFVRFSPVCKASVRWLCQ